MHSGLESTGTVDPCVGRPFTAVLRLVRIWISHKGGILIGDYAPLIEVGYIFCI